MTDLDWVPEGIDTTVPSVARTYDYLLGGAHNLAVDRAMGDQMLKVLPGARDLVRLNRSFLRRAVTYLAERGVRQFLDIGSGIPTRDNPGYQWLAAHAAHYGLFNLPSEPWHWSTNGR